MSVNRSFCPFDRQVANTWAVLFDFCQLCLCYEFFSDIFHYICKHLPNELSNLIKSSEKYRNQIR